MKKSLSGFTLIELSIVIIVVGILASITLVSYRGATARANDAQTINAANQWMKALQMYRARNGSLPNQFSCLGANYKYNQDGKGASGVGQCRQDTAAFGIKENPAFDAMLAPYITSKPTPSMATTTVNSPLWFRGAYYYIYPSGSETHARIDIALSNHTKCPSALGGVPLIGPYVSADKNNLCRYALGNITAYK